MSWDDDVLLSAEKERTVEIKLVLAAFSFAKKRFDDALNFATVLEQIDGRKRAAEADADLNNMILLC